MTADLQIHGQLARELADSNAPPLGSLIADALVTGDRLRRRRRYAVITSGIAGFAVVVAAGVFLASNLGGTGPSMPSIAGAPKTSPPSSAPPGEAARKATTGKAAVAVLIELLPTKGHISEVQVSKVPAGSLLYDDGRGAATVSVLVADKPGNYGPSVTGMQCPPNSAAFVCQHIVKPDGVEVRVMTMGPYTTDCRDLKCSIKTLRVEIRRVDGIYVTAEAYNGPFGHGRAATRTDTILNTAQLLAIVSDSRWGLTMDASFVDKAEQTTFPK